ALGAERSILAQAWSPIGGIVAYGTEATSPLQDPAITEIADAHGKTPAQVILRWHLQEGRQVIPKSVRPQRIAENFDVLGFELSTEELARLDALETGTRGGPEPADLTLESFGMDIPEA
ncbi:MAG: aldo/keto reductase, partial [Brachybacterium tyrofermentans]